MILDGEIVAFDASGRPSFNALQNRVQLKTEREIAAADRNLPVVFYCFDLLYFAGIDLRKAPYRDRRRYLAQCLLPSPLVQLVHASEDGDRAARGGARQRLRGRDRQAQGQPLRGRPALGVVAQGQAHAAAPISSSAATRKARARAQPLGALLVGYWDEGKLRYASHVGLRLRRQDARAGQGAARCRCSARPVRSPKSRS